MVGSAVAIIFGVADRVTPDEALQSHSQTEVDDEPEIGHSGFVFPRFFHHMYFCLFNSFICSRHPTAPSAEKVSEIIASIYMLWNLVGSTQ